LVLPAIRILDEVFSSGRAKKRFKAVQIEMAPSDAWPWYAWLVVAGCTPAKSQGWIGADGEEEVSLHRL
jgi:hypothetical protein